MRAAIAGACLALVLVAYRLDLDTRAMTPIGKVPVDGWAYSADRDTIAFYLETGDGGAVQLAEYQLPAR